VQAVPGSPFSTGLPLPSPMELPANSHLRVDPQNRFVVLLHSVNPALIPKGGVPVATGIVVFTLDPTSGKLTLKGDTALARPARDLALVHP